MVINIMIVALVVGVNHDALMLHIKRVIPSDSDITVNTIDNDLCMILLRTSCIVILGRVYILMIFREGTTLKDHMSRKLMECWITVV